MNLSIGLQMIVGVGDVYQTAVILSGYDPIAGEQLTERERQDGAFLTVATAGAAPVVGAGIVKRAEAYDELLRGLRPNRAAGTRSLAAYREGINVPAVGSAEDIADPSTTARLDLGGNTFFGRSAHGEPTDMYVNSVTRNQAEGHVFQQAKNAKASGRSGVLYVDRPLCQYCGTRGGVGSLMRDVGVDVLLVVAPDGTFVISSTSRPSVPIRIGD